jgi:hypothetical protein
MSQWIDFVIYAAQVIVLWVYLPSWCARMALPMMRDRNAAWVDAHSGALAAAPPGPWFLKACYVWAAVTVAVLLAMRLGLQPLYFLPRMAGLSGWKALMAANYSMLSLGLLVYLGGSVVFLRWLRNTVPQSPLRQATLQPRVIDDYVPRWFRLLVYVAIAAHLATWLYVGALHRFQYPDFWRVFAGTFGLTALMLVLGRAAVLRRPSQIDQYSGDYRRIEIRVSYAIQLVVVGFGAIALCKLLFDIDLQRFGTLAFAVFVAVTLFSMTRPHPGARRSSKALA